ncbi:MAG: carboxypeptidase-like regulatory domain-containing protein [Solirubrobacteraceae bacterium]
MSVIVATAQRHRRAALGALVSVCGLAIWQTPALAAPSQTGSLAGLVTAPSTAGATATVPVAGIAVTATGPTGVTYTTQSAANGYYELDQLPAPATYSVALSLSPGAQPQAQSTAAVTPGSVADVAGGLPEPVATITGNITSPDGQALPGMAVGVQAIPVTPCPSGGICGPTTTTAADGSYALNVAPGRYELAIQDGSRVIEQQLVAAARGSSSVINVRLPLASVPAGTASRHSDRDLRWLNDERAGAGLPAGIVLNPRWALECAAHDAYEQANGVLTHTENAQAPGASSGGAWAGLTSVLAQSRWTQTADPWQSAPIHLMQLFSPSLSVIGIDDGGGLQCATTYPGLLRAPVTSDTVFTYPGDGAGGVPTRETAREAPFVPGQFVGIPAGQTTGRELFVYLNQAGRVGQAQVKLLHATLSQGQHPVTVRWVDNTTKTVGQYLTGAIVIPVSPLRARTTYTASVSLQDRSGTISHSWSFTTAAP